MDADVVSNDSRMFGGSLKETITKSGMQQHFRNRLCQSLTCHSGVNGLDPFDRDLVSLMNRSTVSHSILSHSFLSISSCTNLRECPLRYLTEFKKSQKFICIYFK